MLRTLKEIINGDNSHLIDYDVVSDIFGKGTKSSEIINKIIKYRKRNSIPDYTKSAMVEFEEFFRQSIGYKRTQNSLHSRYIGMRYEMRSKYDLTYKSKWVQLMAGEDLEYRIAFSYDSESIDAIVEIAKLFISIGLPKLNLDEHVIIDLDKGIRKDDSRLSYNIDSIGFIPMELEQNGLWAKIVK